MTTINSSASQPHVIVEKKHEPPTYYKSLVKSGYAPVSGLEMYYEIHGTGKGTPLVTIHPIWGLANVFPTLTKNRQLIAVELQGHGHTADIDRPMSYEQHADDVAALLKHLQIEQADFFGESINSIVAVQMAVRHPELVRRVVTWGAPFGRLEESYDPISSAEFMTLTPDHSSVQFQREAYQRVAPDPTQWPTLYTKVNSIEWKGFSSDELKSIQAPVLIAAGDHDVIGARLEHALEVFRLIPSAQLAIVPDAGHFVLNDDPQKLLPIIETFLADPISPVRFATILLGYHPGETR